MNKTIIIILFLFGSAIFAWGASCTDLTKNAEQGDAASQYKIGRLYFDGKGVPVNYAEAVKWFRRAAKKGHLSAQWMLGTMYAGGSGVSLDYVQAYAWLNIAKASGEKSEQLKTGLDLLTKCATSAQRYQALKLSQEILARIDKNNGTLIEKISNSIGMQFVYVQPGSFIRNGSKVTNTRGYYMQAAEVTQGQWEAIMGTRPWAGKNYVQADVNNPAVYISWNDCKAFIRKLNQKEGVHKYRLPTESEWEFAARGGSNSAYCFGDDENQLGDYAWYDKNTWDVGEKYAHGVALKKANQYGLYDMHGNVWEWCEDRYGNNSIGKITGSAAASDVTQRTHRGGSWYYNASRSRAAVRYGLSPGYRYFSLGFRLSRSL